MQPLYSESLWQTKARVEAMYPDFPHLDPLTMPMDQYATTVRDMLTDAAIPLTPFHTTWQNLTCTAPTADAATAIQTFLPRFRKSSKPPPDTSVLDNVSGYLKPGQMCLVLGTSGAGTSTLLSLLAGIPPPKKLTLTGDVLYAGQKQLLGFVRPSHITHFVRQYDVHIPELTVRQTLQFAADCRWPDFLPHVKSLRHNDVVTTARVLGISRVLDTIVGSDELRGVSGGERKRVTLGEMGIGMVSGTLVMDNWSKGLDAATTLSITRSIREFTEFTQGSAIVSMQAPGTEAYNLFDTVCMLHQGRMMYFGPPDQAESYFNSIGFSRPPYRSVPDFVSTLTEPKLRHEYVSRDTHPPPPVTAEDFANLFEKSSYHEDLNRTIEELNREPGIPEVHLEPHIAKLAQKTTLQSPRHQLLALFRRQGRFLLSIRRTVLTELLENLIFGILLGSVFWQLPDTPGGAQSRGGIVFLALLFVALNALAALPTKFDRKRIFLKQREASFFDAWTYLLSQAVFDLLLEISKAICLMVPLYLMSGLNLGGSGQRLLYAILIASFASLTNISLTTFIVALFDDVNTAQGASGILVIIFVLFNGFLKNSDILQKWLIWIYWIDPLHYSFEALIINEYEGLQFFCNPEDLLPPVEAIPVDFRICPVSTGEQYIADNFGITEDKIYRLYFFLIVVGFNSVIFIASAIATALAKPKGHAHVPIHPPADVDTLVHLSTSRTMKDVTIDVSDGGNSEPPVVNFTFTNMSYTVDDGRKVLLEGVTGNAVSGKVVLLMGESGAGKTTLLDVLAMRKTLKGGANVSGEVRFNGEMLNKKTLAQVSGYCEQSDLHIGETTVEEAVVFSAKLRLPQTMDLSEKMERVEDTLARLGLQTYRNKLVKSLGSGEMKLLTMAVEVVSDPRVLFLDEPTSGISSSSAMTVARVMQSIAENGTSVICTIHQPSKEVFTMFDRLLLLKRGGKTVYFGGIGENGQTLRSYFESHGARPMNEEENPADWMLEVIDNDEKDWVEQWKQSSEKQSMDAETEALASHSSSDGQFALSKYDVPKSTRFSEAREVIHRQFRRYWRLPEYNTTRLVLNLLIGIIIGLLYLQDIDDTQAGASLALAALFLTLIPTNLTSTNVVEPTASGRVVFYREVASGIYRSSVHHLAVGLVELPFLIMATIPFVVVFYFMVGLTASRFGYFFVASIVLHIFAVMFGIMMGTITPNENLARSLISAISSLLNVLSGFFIRKPEMPSWWRWSTWVNPYSYYLSGVVQNQMSGMTFVCEPEELGRFERPTSLEPGGVPVTSCADIPGGEFGDIVLDDGTPACTFCPVPNGDAVIQRFEADEVNKWVGLVAIVVSIVIFRIITGIGVSKLRFLTR